MESMHKDDLVLAVRALGWDVADLPGKLFATPRQINEWLHGIAPVPNSVATIVRRALQARRAQLRQQAAPGLRR